MYRLKPLRKGFLVFLSFFPVLVSAEGTKEIMPDSTLPTRILIAWGTVGGQQRDPFAVYNGDTNYRLYIHISDFTSEVIYFGLGQNSGAALPWRIHDPTGAVVWSGNTPTNGQPGFINYYSQAVTGPNVLGASGYNPLSVTPAMNGDYFMTFQINSGQQRDFRYFDITVVNTSTVPVSAIPGRIYSKNWQIRNPQAGTPPQWVLFYGNMFIYSPDGIVTRLNPNGFEGRDFSFGCNESGCYPVGPGMPANQARKSAEGRHTYPQYKVFVNNPDSTTYPSGVLGALVNNNPVVQTVTSCDSGTVKFIFEVTAPGSVEIILDLSTLGSQYTDRVLTQYVTAGWDTLVWDGYDGSVPPKLILNGSQFPFTITYINGMTHLPLYDVENNASGFLLNLIRPAGPEPAFYWDDTDLNPPMTPGPPQNPPGGCFSSINPCHIWSGSDPGNERSVNTWWYVANTTTAPVTITFLRKPPPPGPITGPASVCPGSSGHIYWINTEPSSTSYVWGYTGTGATITPVNDTTISASYANNATSGNLTVAGVNIECGQGNNRTKAITLLPSPVVSLAPFAPVCIDTPPFALTGGTPAGGTYTIGGVPVVIFNPAAYGVGSHQVTYTYTDPGTTCTASDQKNIVVNPLPVVTLAPLAAVCVNVPPYTLSGGSPAGGTYSGPGVTGGSTFNPSVAGAGTHLITYAYTDANSCTSSDTKSITVYPLTPVTLPPFNPICVNAPPLTLTGGTPAGGIYSGPGVTAGIFDPAAAGVGTHPIVYTYTDGNSCTNADTSTITVTPLPGTPGGITGPDTVCQDTPSVPYTTTAIANATSYIWTILPAGAGTVIGSTASILVNWSATFSGTAQITVKGLNNCGEGMASVPFPVTLHPNPVVSFTRCFDSVTLTTAKPIILKGGTPLNGTYTGQGIVSGILYPGLAGGGVHTITYAYTNGYNCTKSATKSITIQTPLPWNCGSVLTDPRDGKQYPTVLIGSQCWMAADLNYGQPLTSSTSQRDNCIVEKYCYNDLPVNCTTTGGRYQWDEVMAYQTEETAQGLCPPGWHLPSEAEWILLFSNFINSGFAGSALKVTGYTGFNALLAGFQGFNLVWKYGAADPVLRSTLFWSSTSRGPDKAWAHGMNEVVADIEYTPSVSFYPSWRNQAFAVRCLKD